MNVTKYLTIATLLLLCSSCSSPEVIINRETVPMGKIHRLSIESQFVDERPIDVWLPECYPNGGPYDVLYMHDGGSLFGLSKPDMFNNAEWGVDETISDLMDRGVIPPTIVVGVYNIGLKRSAEYFPQKAIKYIDESFLKRGFLDKVKDEANADNYLRYLTEEVKPYIDSNYSVNSGREHTFIMGSSMGGLISMYAHCEYPDVFSGSASLSTHFIGLMERNDEIPSGIIEYMSEALPKSSREDRFYFDYGDQGLDSLYNIAQSRVDSLMSSKGYDSSNWQTHFHKGEDHSPKSWSKTLDIPIRFMMGGREVSQKQTDKKGNTYRLYYLGGQSNMEGFGFTSELPSEFNRVHRDVMIYTGATAPNNHLEGRALGCWDYLRPGHGMGYNSDGVYNSYSDRFGPELTFGVRMSEIYPDEKIAILKYTRGGSSLDGESGWGTWLPEYKKSRDEINQFDNFLLSLKYASSVKDIDGDGVEDTLIPSGIVWMQGESDGTKLPSAKVYEQNLRRVVELFREALGDDDLPVVIGKVSDSRHSDSNINIIPYMDMINRAQISFADQDVAAKYVPNSENYRYHDAWHYTSDCYIDLGVAFADAMSELER